MSEKLRIGKPVLGLLNGGLDIAACELFGATVAWHVEYDGQPRLNAAFVEWMMGLPEGHITGQLGIGREGIKKRLPRTAVLKAIGNGVCPQQALAALAILDPRQAA